MVGECHAKALVIDGNRCYRRMPFNSMGQICLKNSMVYTIAATIIVWLVYPAVDRDIRCLPREAASSKKRVPLAAECQGVLASISARPIRLRTSSNALAMSSKPNPYLNTSLTLKLLNTNSTRRHRAAMAAASRYARISCER